MREITFFYKANQQKPRFWIKTGKLFMLFFVLLSVIQMQAQAPPDVTDGLPDGWPQVMQDYPYPFGSYIVDLQNDPEDDIWAQGSSDVDVIANWSTAYNSSNDKNDLKNTGAVTIYDPVSMTTSIYFFADRYSNRGDSDLGYWLLQGAVEKTENGFIGSHQDGDILLKTKFINGGSTALRAVYIWLNGQLQEIELSASALNFTSNSGITPVPESWDYNPKAGAPGTYPRNSFVEGFLNLTTLETEIAQNFQFDFDPCFSYFVISTGNSASENSSLEDLVAGQYGSKPEVQELVGSTVCSDVDNVGTVSMLDSEINITYQIQQLVDGDFVNVPGQDPVQGSANGFLEFTGLTSGEYYVNAYIGNSKCETLSGPVSVVVNVVEGGDAGSPQTICSGEDPGELEVTGASGDGDVSYQWQYSTNGATYLDIETNSKNATYDPGVLTMDTWYKRITKYTLNEVECEEESSPVKVTVNNIGGGLIESAQAICEGDIPDPLYFQQGSGAFGDGDLTYQWEFSLSGEEDDFQEVPSNGQEDSYSPGALYQDTWYRVVTTSTLNEVACSAISNKVKVTVNDLPVPLDADIAICADETDTVLSNYDAAVLGAQEGSVDWYNGDPLVDGQKIDAGNPFDLTQNDVDLFATVTLNSTKCEASIDISLTINPLPVVQILEPPADLVCITDMVQADPNEEFADPVPRQFQARVDGEIWTVQDLNGTWSGDVDDNGTYDPLANPNNMNKTITFTYVYPDTKCEASDTIAFTVEEPEVSDPIEESICIFDIPSEGLEIGSDYIDSNENGNIIGEITYEMNEMEFDGIFNPTELGVYSILATYSLENKACEKTVNVIITVTDCLDCETAFARPMGEDTSNDMSYCFINEVPDYEGISTDVLNSERWGWTNLIRTADFTADNNYTKTLKLYAGAGGCDINNAIAVGELSIVYNEEQDHIVVTYEIERAPDEIGYIFSGAHLYVGEDPYPSKKKGKTLEYTVAPGKYPFNTRGGIDPTYKIVYTIEEVLPEFYLIAHASACTSFTKEFMDDLWANAEVEYVSYKKDDYSMITSNRVNAQSADSRLSSSTLKETSEPIFNVAPVPFKQELNIEYLFDYTSDVTIQLYDMNGRLLRTFKDHAVNSSSASKFNIDFKTKSGRVYLLRMTTDREIFTGKIISGR